MSVTDDRNSAQRYSAEWANPNRLSRDGITKDTLKAGDHVIVTGSPGRNASENKIHLKQIERPADGWKWRRR
jgi:hydrogenase maturation factor